VEPNAVRSPDVSLKKVAEEQVEYLVACGLTYAQATAAIVYGFLNIETMGLLPQISAEIRKAIGSSESCFSPGSP